MALSKAQINAIRDFGLRTVLLGIYAQLEVHNNQLGSNFIEPTNSPQEPSSAPPPLASLMVSGANGIFTVAITNPTQSINKTLYHELSYSTIASFVGGSGVTTLPVSTSTHQTVAQPNLTVFWRLRSSYDQSNWNAYQTQPGAVASGLQSSAASSDATVLNQTNYATVDSASSVDGTSAVIRVYGKSGLNTQYPSVKGGVDTILPSATIINVPFSVEQVVGFQGADYVARGTLPEVLTDGVTPIGAVSVVGSGDLVLPVALVIADVGTGATPGAQTITGGILISIANGSAGTGYTPGTQPVTVTGGRFGGSTGGGQNIGGNGGRLVVNDGTTG